MSNIFKYLVQNKNRSNNLVMGVIIETGGSTPQVTGASAIFSSDGIVAGTLGGGLLEFEAMNNARRIIGTGSSSLFTFNLNSDISESDGAICGGRAQVLLDSSWINDLSLFSEMEKSFSEGKAGVLITSISGTSEDKISLERHWCEDGLLTNPEENRSSRLSGSDIMSVYETRTPGIIKFANEANRKSAVDKVYLEPVFPEDKLIIIGAGHIGNVLTHLGSLLDFNVTVIDDRPEYANKEKLPDAHRVITGNIKDAVRSLKITPDSYIVIVTAGHKSDADALEQCIHSKAAYIGMIGSGRKIALIKKKFLENGLATEDQFSKIHAPIGIQIMSKTIQEISVSIAAELIQVRRQKQVNTRNTSVWTIVLAAGEARRMKKQKLLMPYGKSSMIGTIVQKNMDSKADGVMVVLGSDYEKLNDALKKYKIHTTFNKNYRAGMLSSVQTGIRALPGNASGAIIFLGDQPMIPGWVIDKLIDLFVSKSKKIILPVSNGERGHPILIDRRYFREILDMDTKESLHTFIADHNMDVTEIEINTTDILRDIDTIDEYENEINQSK